MLISTLFHNVFKFPSVSGQLSLEVTDLPGTSKVMVSNLTRICFSKRLLLSVFFCPHFSLGLFLVFDLRLHFVILLTLTSYFLCFPCFAKNISRPKLFWLVFHRPYGLDYGRFKTNTILALPSALFKLIVCLPIVLWNFQFFRSGFLSFFAKTLVCLRDVS